NRQSTDLKHDRVWHRRVLGCWEKQSAPLQPTTTMGCRQAQRWRCFLAASRQVSARDAFASSGSSSNVVKDIGRHGVVEYTFSLHMATPYSIVSAQMCTIESSRIAGKSYGGSTQIARPDEGGAPPQASQFPH